MMASNSRAFLLVTVALASVTLPGTPAPADGDAPAGFRITLDDRMVAGSLPAAPAASALSPDPTFDLHLDGAATERQLTLELVGGAADPGGKVTLRAMTDYPDFIARAELVVLQRNGGEWLTRATVPAKLNADTSLRLPDGAPGEFAVRLRAYDRNGRYDQTAILPLADAPLTATLEHRQIPLRGGRVAIAGRAPGLTTVIVAGTPVPVEPGGDWSLSRILPTGPHVVTVDAGARHMERAVTVPNGQWFGVGIIDVTLGYRLQDDLGSPDPDFEATWAEGRAGFFVEGTTAGGLQVTASADTGPGPLRDMFSRLDEKDPRAVLGRIDADDAYPTFGDDAAIADRAPTSGRVFLELRKDNSSFLWGDFQTDGRGLLAANRTLYGARAELAPPTPQRGSEPKVRAKLFAAQPDTLPQRDVLRGTGGSVYFLSRQDISPGSETVTIQTSDPVTGRIVATSVLTAGVDYDVNYVQGVLMLAQPVSSSAAGGGLIGGGSGANDVDLVVQYEYTPATGDLDGASLGARIEARPTDALRLGVTATRDATGTADQTGLAADLDWTFGAGSRISAELATTRGPGFGQAISTDGGLTINSSGAGSGRRAGAWRLNVDLDARDLGAAGDGHLKIWSEGKNAGFATLTETVTEDQRTLGLSAEWSLRPDLAAGVDAERFTTAGGTRRIETEARLAWDLGPAVTVTGALGTLDATVPGRWRETGRRSDAAVRLDWRASPEVTVFGYGRQTLTRSGGIGPDDRVGLGIDAQLGDRLGISGEISQGDSGPGAEARLALATGPGSEVYLGYALDPGASVNAASSARDRGTLVWGSRFARTDTVSGFVENTLDLGADRTARTEAYGLNWTPSGKWTVSGTVELGKVRDDVGGDFDRTGWSLGTTYGDNENLSARARIEYRTEDGAGVAQDRRTWGLAAGLENRLNDNWRLIAALDALLSRSNQSAWRDGEFVDASIGYAYRPVTNERTNLLFRYRYLRDLPGPDQVNASGSTSGPRQVSHVLSVDGDRDLTRRLTLGAKYGYRVSQVAPRGSKAFSASTAHLGILRLDWHAVHAWDVTGEIRALRGVETGTTEFGSMLGVWRHLGPNAKIGLGYEWGRVSDDITALDYDAQGIFLNLVGKF